LEWVEIIGDILPKSDQTVAIYPEHDQEVVPAVIQGWT